MEVAQKEQIQKPMGVYILTICLFLRFGIFQFIIDFNTIHDADRRVPLIIAIILIGRNVFVAGSAVWAFLGENWGRISLLTIVSLNVLWSIFNVITYLSFSQNETDAMGVTYTLFNPIFWLVMCWWYMNRKNVVEYYKRNEHY
jgi:hypothetical protein